MIARRCSTPLVALLLLNALLVIVLILRSSSVDECAAPQSTAQHGATEAATQEASSLRRIKCLVEGTRRLQCLRENDEVYLPFNGFLRKQFDVNGRLNKDVSEPRFEYYTSYAKVRVPELSSYDPFGPFGHFGSYNVEIRDRVRCISAEHGVPMSVQWDSIPYFYPIQVAQFALQHYSRNRTESTPVVRGLSASFEKSSSQVDAETTTEGGARILVSRASTSDFIQLKLDENASLPILRFSWSPQSADAWFSVEVQELRSGKHVRLNYKQLRDRQCVWADTEWDDYSEKEKAEELSFTYALGTLTPSE
ncbi:D-glucuronyl C5 epimerase [Aphelenchoides avenae]|nr:D-glucuronyl C5 epimerase [Aphelenchus avenae]